MKVWVAVTSLGIPILETTERSRDMCVEMIEATGRKDDELSVVEGTLSLNRPKQKRTKACKESSLVAWGTHLVKQKRKAKK